MEVLNPKAETGCCERFNPEPWDEKEIILEDRLFLKEHVFCIFHIPINFGSIMKRSMEIIQKTEALTDEPLLLYEDKSLFGADVYIAVSKEVPNAEMKTISGTFLTKVFEGSFNNTGKWIKEMEQYVKSKNKTMKTMYFFYTTCPKCAKFYGKNYTVIFAEI